MVSNSASVPTTMDTMRVLVLWLPTAWGLGAVREVATQPPPSSPALVIRTDVHDRRMMTEDITGHVVRIRRAFDAAFQRMCEAKNPEAAEDELSNLLCQLYRLSELVT